MSTRIQSTASQIEPTDLSAISNLSPVTTAGHGGPHGVFDKNNFKAQMRLEDRIIDLSARLGQVIGKPYTWAIVLIEYNDDFTSKMIPMNSTDLQIKNFITEQMQIFIDLYDPKTLWFVESNVEIKIDEFSGVF